MNKFASKLVHFKCCNTIITFNVPKEFKYCKCGKSVFDSGDEYYSRILGNKDDISISESYRTDDCPSA